MTREHLIDHVVEVIAESGMNGLSIRTVAARADVAIGTVQHWFPTTTTMLLAAMDRIGQVGATASAAVKAPHDPAAELHGMIRLLVPPSTESRISHVWLAFAAHAVTDEQVRERYEQLWAGMHTGLTRLLAAARPAAPAGLIDDAATELVALTDGLTVAVLTEPHRMSPTRAAELATRRLNEILALLPH